MSIAPGSKTARLSEDTSRDVEDRQIAIWRSMSPAEILELVGSASQATRDLALAGLRSRYPGASERELIARLARITLGNDLARRVYPELDRLVP